MSFSASYKSAFGVATLNWRTKGPPAKNPPAGTGGRTHLQEAELPRGHPSGQGHGGWPLSEFELVGPSRSDPPFRRRRPSAVMLSALPVEIVLEIIQRLPVATLASLSALSKPWAAFMDANESSIYHGASKRYGFAPIGDPNAAPPPEGWKAWREFLLAHPC